MTNFIAQYVAILTSPERQLNRVCHRPFLRICEWWGQGRIKASAGPGAVPNAGPLQTYNQLTTPTNCGPQNCGPGCCSTPSTPLNAALGGETCSCGRVINTLGRRVQ